MRHLSDTGFVVVGECSCDIESRALDPEPMTQYHNCVSHAPFLPPSPGMFDRTKLCV